MDDIKLSSVARAAAMPAKATSTPAATSPAPAYSGDNVDPVGLAAASEAAKARPASLNGVQLGEIVKKKATCPFIGTALAQRGMPVRNNAENPLASIDDVVKLGNEGGGDLGNLLKLFATGNHARMLGADGKLDAPVPAGLFSLIFPGSQGSHPGDSGILQTDPGKIDSGEFTQANFGRLLGRAKNGCLKRSDIAKFIAENMRRDPNSKVLDTNVTKLIAGDVARFVGQTGPAFEQHLRNKLQGTQGSDQQRQLVTDLTKNLGEDNLVGSAGEFGLLLAFLEHSPRTQKVDGELAVSVEDVTAMFVNHEFPKDWQTWPKTEADWVVNTTALTLEAGKEFHRLQKQPRS